MSVEFSLSVPQILQFLLAIVLPLLVGLVTTKETSANRKAVLLAALSVVTALLTSLLAAAQAGTTYDLGTGLLSAIGTFVIAVAMHYGLWKPTSISTAAQNSLVKSSDSPAS